VTVLARTGEPVTGLGVDDFTLLVATSEQVK
jgi:hypothetical protein